MSRFFGSSNATAATGPMRSTEHWPRSTYAAGADHGINANGMSAIDLIKRYKETRTGYEEDGNDIANRYNLGSRMRDLDIALVLMNESPALELRKKVYSTEYPWPFSIGVNKVKELINEKAVFDKWPTLNGSLDGEDVTDRLLNSINSEDIRSQVKTALEGTAKACAKLTLLDAIPLVWDWQKCPKGTSYIFPESCVGADSIASRRSFQDESETCQGIANSWGTHTSGHNDPLVTFSEQRKYWCNDSVRQTTRKLNYNDARNILNDTVTRRTFGRFDAPISA